MTGRVEHFLRYLGGARHSGTRSGVNGGFFWRRWVGILWMTTLAPETFFPAEAATAQAVRSLNGKPLFRPA